MMVGVGMTSAPLRCWRSGVPSWRRPGLLLDHLEGRDKRSAHELAVRTDVPFAIRTRRPAANGRSGAFSFPGWPCDEDPRSRRLRSEVEKTRSRNVSCSRWMAPGADNETLHWHLAHGAGALGRVARRLRFLPSRDKNRSVEISHRAGTLTREVDWKPKSAGSNRRPVGLSDGWRPALAMTPQRKGSIKHEHHL
jgi:hypothetical protein